MGIGIHYSDQARSGIEMRLDLLPAALDRVREAVRRLVAGWSLRSVDGGVAVTRLSETDVVTLAVRDARSPDWVVHLAVRPLGRRELEVRGRRGEPVDDRGPATGDSWRTIEAETVTWELFNASIVSARIVAG